MRSSRSTYQRGSIRLSSRPKRADLTDIPAILALGAAFHAEERWSGLLTYQEASFRRSCELLIERGAIFLTERGLIGLSLGPSIYNHALTVCSELFFWAPDGKGDLLRK